MPDLTPYLAIVRSTWVLLPTVLRFCWAIWITGTILWAAFSWVTGRVVERLVEKKSFSFRPGSRAARRYERAKRNKRPKALTMVRATLWSIWLGVGGETLLLATPVVLAILSAWTFLDVTLLQQMRDRDRPTSSISTGRDDAGRSATYQIILVSGEYYWKYGDTSAVVNFEGREVSLEEKLRSNGIAALLNRSTDIIAVGTASCVGSGSEEENRAYERARTLVGWVKQIELSKSVENLYLLNLGQYNEPCGYGPREHEQRLVLIVGVTNKQAGVDIRQSFRDAITQATRAILRRLDLKGYTNWPEARFFLEPAL